MITKGNWKHSVSKNGRHQISGDSGKQVCLMWNCAERDSNAALISCAPKMYEMLERQARMLHKMGFTDESDEINALLAKARGE